MDIYNCIIFNSWNTTIFLLEIFIKFNVQKYVFIFKKTFPIRLLHEMRRKCEKRQESLIIIKNC